MSLFLICVWDLAKMNTAEGQRVTCLECPANFRPVHLSFSLFYFSLTLSLYFSTSYSAVKAKKINGLTETVTVTAVSRLILIAH